MRMGEGGREAKKANADLGQGTEFVRFGGHEKATAT